MKAYVITTGIVFGLIVAAHIARLAFEGLGPFRDPSFIFFSVVSGALALWSLRVLKAINLKNRDTDDE